MTDSVYQTPQSDVNNKTDFISALLTPLAATKGWARLISVLGFIGGGFMILAGIGMMAAGNITAAKMPGMTAGIGAFYIIFSLLYFIPSFFLFRYASSISVAVSTQSADEIINALNAQKSFWKFAGIISLIMIVIAIVGVAAAIMVPMMAGR